MNLRRRPRTAVRTVAAGALLAVVTVGASACSGGGGADGRAGDAGDAGVPPSAAAVTAPGRAAVAPTGAVHHTGRRGAVGVRTDTYVDRTRPTTAVEGYPGAADRTFPVTVWYPADGDPAAPPVVDAPPDRRGGPYPLVLFSHGYAVTPDVYEALLARWAAAGYVVVAPTYPLLSGVPAGPSHADYGTVFADQQFVLDRVLADLGAPGGPHPLAGMVDPARVAAAGQSDGEVAAFGAAFLECCRDPRVKAVIAMAGNLGNVNNPVRDDLGIPVLHLIGEADELQPYADALAWDRDHLATPRWIVTLVGGTHAPPYRDPDDPHFAGVVDLTTAFLDGTLAGDPARLAAIVDVVDANGGRFRLER